MSNPKYTITSYPFYATTTPQTRNGIYLSYNNHIPLFVNGRPQMSAVATVDGAPYLWRRDVPSFGQAMFDGELEMKQPGIVSRQPDRS
jgi:hypothetical protein